MVSLSLSLSLFISNEGTLSSAVPLDSLVSWRGDLSRTRTSVRWSGSLQSHLLLGRKVHLEEEQIAEVGDRRHFRDERPPNREVVRAREIDLRETFGFFSLSLSLSLSLQGRHEKKGVSFLPFAFRLRETKKEEKDSARCVCVGKRGPARRRPRAHSATSRGPSGPRGTCVQRRERSAFRSSLVVTRSFLDTPRFGNDSRDFKRTRAGVTRGLPEHSRSSLARHSSTTPLSKTNGNIPRVPDARRGARAEAR